MTICTKPLPNKSSPTTESSQKPKLLQWLPLFLICIAMIVGFSAVTYLTDEDYPSKESELDGSKTPMHENRSQPEENRQLDPYTLKYYLGLSFASDFSLETTDHTFVERRAVFQDSLKTKNMSDVLQLMWFPLVNGFSGVDEFIKEMGWTDQVSMFTYTVQPPAFQEVDFPANQYEPPNCDDKGLCNPQLTFTGTNYTRQIQISPATLLSETFTEYPGKVVRVQKTNGQETFRTEITLREDGLLEVIDSKKGCCESTRLYYIPYKAMKAYNTF